LSYERLPVHASKAPRVPQRYPLGSLPLA